MAQFGANAADGLEKVKASEFRIQTVEFAIIDKLVEGMLKVRRGSRWQSLSPDGCAAI